MSNWQMMMVMKCDGMGHRELFSCLLTPVDNTGLQTSDGIRIAYTFIFSCLARNTSYG